MYALKVLTPVRISCQISSDNPGSTVTLTGTALPHSTYRNVGDIFI